MRSDGDQWDITTSVGATALGVAAARAVESRRDDALVDDPYAQTFVDRAGVDLRLPGTVTAEDGGGEVWDVMSTYLGVRSRFFDEFLAEATGAGVRQVVLLAAGLDARAFRLTWPTGVAVFEVDRSAVLAFKDDVLATQDADAAVRRETVRTDLRDDWPAALRDAGFDASRPTAWLAEGLLPYLPPEAETALFDRVQALSAPGSRIAVEHFGDNTMAFDDHPRIQRMQQTLGVDVRQLVYLEGRDRTPDVRLAELGWKTLGVRARDLATAYGRPLDADIVEAMGTIELMEGVRLAA